MVDNLGYTIHTRDIPIGVFLDMIKGDIKKLIQTYGHKNCGLMHEELCEKIKKIITSNKTLILSYTNEHGKQKLISEWESQKKEFFNNLFEEEGFINMCYPLKKKGNQKLQTLKLKHIQFCKDKDVRRAAVEANPEYNDCREYNSWIETEKASFTHEYLKNVKDFKLPAVNGYFITQEHPLGHDPRRTYNKSKLDCEIYNPASIKYQKKKVEEAATNKPQLPMEPNIERGSQGKDKISVTDGDSASEKKKINVKKPLQNESPTTDSQITASPKTQAGGTHIGQATHAITKAPVSTVSRNGKKQEATPIQDQSPTNRPPSAQAEASPQAESPPRSPKDTRPTPAIQSVPVPTPTTSLFSTLATVNDTTSDQTPTTSSSLTINPASSLNSVSPSPSDSLLPVVVTKDQDTPSHSTKTPITSANTYSTETLPEPSVAVPSLDQSKPPAVSTPPAIIASQEPGTPASSSASTFTNTVMSTTPAPAAVTIPTMSTTHELISSAKEATSASSSQESPPTSAAVGPEAAPSATDRDHQKIVIPAPTPLSESDTANFSVQRKADRDPGNKLASAVLSKPKGTIQVADNSLSIDTQQASGHPLGTRVRIPDSTLQNIKHHPNQQFKTAVIHNPHRIAVISPSSKKNDASVKTSKDGSTVRNNKNDNSNTEPEDLSPLINIIPIILIILTSATALFLLYKYTPFGLLLGRRRRKKKKRDLRRIFEIPEKPTYESPNITVHEWEDPNLVGKVVENDVYIKLLKINRYKQEMQKRKKKNKKTLIEVHMEVLEEYKSDEWELHKGDFLEICLRGFVNEENETYQNFPNSKLTINNINEKTIEDIQKQEILWNNWIEDHRNILEQWKKEEWFHILKNKWKKEQQIYKANNNKLQENILNEEEKHSIVSQKDIWKQWILKQATLIDMFNKEDWFKSIVYAQDKEKNNYHINEYNDISVTSKTELKNEKSNQEYSRSKDIIQKLMVQIHMMVLEESIKEDIIKHKEVCIDNFIEDIHTQNNYDEKRNMPQSDIDNFKVPEFEVFTHP